MGGADLYSGSRKVEVRVRLRSHYGGLGWWSSQAATISSGIRAQMGPKFRGVRASENSGSLIYVCYGKGREKGEASP